MTERLGVESPVTLTVDDVPVGLVEIAVRLSVERDTVQKWRTRGLLPAPDWTVGGRPAWRWATVERWAKKTNRMPGRMDEVMIYPGPLHPAQVSAQLRLGAHVAVCPDCAKPDEDS